METRSVEVTVTGLAEGTWSVQLSWSALGVQPLQVTRDALRLARSVNVTEGSTYSAQIEPRLQRSPLGIVTELEPPPPTLTVRSGSLVKTAVAMVVELALTLHVA